MILPSGAAPAGRATNAGVLVMPWLASRSAVAASRCTSANSRPWPAKRCDSDLNMGGVCFLSVTSTTCKGGVEGGWGRGGVRLGWRRGIRRLGAVQVLASPQAQDGPGRGTPPSRQAGGA